MSTIDLMFFLSWVLGAVFICSNSNDDYSFNKQGKIESQRMSPIHWGPMKSLWFWIYLITLYQLTQAILVLIWVWLNWCEECFTANLLPQIMSELLVEVDEFYLGAGFQSCIFHMIVPDEIGKNPLEYLEVQVLDSLSARMRHQPKDVDHMRCNSTKTLR